MPTTRNTGTRMLPITAVITARPPTTPKRCTGTQNTARIMAITSMCARRFTDTISTSMANGPYLRHMPAHTFGAIELNAKTFVLYS